jgi:hypothetical protein
MAGNHLFKNKNMTEDGLRNVIKKEYDIIAAGCEFYYPFANSSIGPFRD